MAAPAGGEASRPAYWRADDNEGVSLESVSKEIAAYKPGGTFAEDYAAFVQLLQVVAHPKVGAVAIAKSCVESQVPSSPRPNPPTLFQNFPNKTQQKDNKL